MNNRAIQILRGSLDYEPSEINTELLDGQPFYSKKNELLYVGDKSKYVETTNPDGTTTISYITRPVGASWIKPGAGKGSFISACLEDIDGSPYGDSLLPTATGHEAIAFGQENRASGNLTVVFGVDNEGNGDRSLIIGTHNINNGDDSFISGLDNTNNGSRSIISGLGNTLGNDSTPSDIDLIIGASNNVIAASSTVIGNDNIISAVSDSNLTFNPSTDICIVGSNNRASGDNLYLFGHNLVADGELDRLVVGYFNLSRSNTIFEIGAGTRSTPKNIFLVDKSGNTYISGNIVSSNAIPATAPTDYINVKDKLIVNSTDGKLIAPNILLDSSPYKLVLNNSTGFTLNNNTTLLIKATDSVVKINEKSSFETFNTRSTKINDNTEITSSSFETIGISTDLNNINLSANANELEMNLNGLVYSYNSNAKIQYSLNPTSSKDNITLNTDLNISNSYNLSIGGDITSVGNITSNNGLFKAKNIEATNEVKGSSILATTYFKSPHIEDNTAVNVSSDILINNSKSLKLKDTDGKTVVHVDSTVPSGFGAAMAIGGTYSEPNKASNITLGIWDGNIQFLSMNQEINGVTNINASGNITAKTFFGSLGDTGGNHAGKLGGNYFVVNGADNTTITFYVE